MTANDTSPNPTWDVASDPDAESIYECLSCGARVTDTSHPGSCPRCDDPLRNRATSLE
ncbi:rubrerythrin-like domain-containing protein [Halalkalicoccus ordinarius]|uniref:rubrerythrin-like domain-containing protein n=1 Tax=Halalkalicoccus ordinarius TaxID=3116651 RepID=UPI00300EFEAE